MKKIDILLKKNLVLGKNPVQELLPIFNEIYSSISSQNLDFQKGIIYLKSVPSGVRLKILLQKQKIKQEARKKGFYVRDIL
jgi:hypothetical protein